MSNILKISEAASLALHTMTLLAARSDSLFPTGEVASTLQVSEAHLSKVLQRLARVGLVKSIRGPKGGFKLSRDGHTITLLEVYEAIEGPLRLGACLMGAPICSGNCILGGLVGTINKEVHEYLAKPKLSELKNVYGRRNA